jgi:diguanylate cyclase (GGDEF)-like protein
MLELAVGLLLIAVVAAAAFFLGRASGRGIRQPRAVEGAFEALEAEAAPRALEALGAGIVIVAKSGSGANPAARGLLGFDADEARLRALPELAPLLEAGSGKAELSIGEGAGLRKIEARAFPLDASRPEEGRVLVLSDVTKPTALLEELSALASRDALTGAFNRRRFDELGERDIELARRSGSEIAALMLDIDFFKRVNDEHGHAVGDELLKAVVDTAQIALRSSDVLCRYGGEEFAVLLPGTGRDECLVVAERLRARIAEASIPCPSGEVRVTVSLGAYSGRPKNGEDLALYLRRADEALYRSKALGRNRSSFWQPIGKEA